EELIEVLNKLEERDGENNSVPKKASWKVRYYVSGDPDLFRQVGNTLLQEPIGEVKQHHWE
ncbi:MAG: glutamate racemase, partial [Desulfitobacterium hafniense]|nr:glutamate racemase [Desulfitobacterium hafniense]